MSFGDRVILRVYILPSKPAEQRHCWDAMAVEKLPDEDTLRSVAPRIPIDAHRRQMVRSFRKQPGALSSAAGVYPRVADCGGGLRDFGLEWDDLTVWFPIFGKLRKAKIRTLSGGERRILECFVILRSRSLFAVLDEPFSQVAPLHVVTLKALIRAEKRNKGILLTDHMYRHVTDVADRLYVLANGQTYLTQDAEDLVRYGYLNHL